MFELKRYLQQRRQQVETALDQYTPAADTAPDTIHQAMRHSLFAGGKRLRPILTLAAAEACERPAKIALPQACALECIHTFSLVHDDLPCMDDDELRRGQPTCHVVYGEAIALLAGDALQALAFEILSSQDTPQLRRQIQLLAHSSGSQHLIGGQVLDLQGEQRDDLTISELESIHLGKTAALLSCSLQLGALAADANEDQIQALTSFGKHTGLAFQIIDDILDVTADTATLGKTAGKDQAAGKGTYPALIGLDASRAEAKRHTDAALQQLNLFGDQAQALDAIAHHLLDRSF